MEEVAVEVGTVVVEDMAAEAVEVAETLAGEPVVEETGGEEKRCIFTDFLHRRVPVMLSSACAHVSLISPSFLYDCFSPYSVYYIDYSHTNPKA